MMARLAEIGIILVVVAWSMGVAVSAGETTLASTPSPALTPTEIVITDDLQPYFGSMGPESPLFGLKLAMENLDEAFTLNTSEKVMKQMRHAELRIAEAKGLLLMNKTAGAERALDGYFEKMNLTVLDISSIPARTTGISGAYRQQVKHELVLWDLIREHPGSARLLQAYNRTLDLETTFIEKSGERIENRIQQQDRITARIVRVATGTPVQSEDRGSTTETTASITPDHGKGREKQVEKGAGATPDVTRTTPVSDNGSGKEEGNQKNGKGPK